MNKDQRKARLKWYEDAPLCPLCGQHPTHVAEAKIGFFGLTLTYFDRCNACLPDKVAQVAERIKQSMLEVSP